jgi:putative copper export protein
MDALLKTSAYLGALLLLGAGLYRFVLAPDAGGRPLRRLALLGAALLAFGSLGDLVWTLIRLTGRFDPGLTLEYTLTTRHGRWVLARVALAALLVWLVRTPRPWLFGLTGAGVLASFSVLSHGAVMHGTPALLADFGHLVAATLWGGAVLFAALNWRELGTQRLAVLGRVSRIGLWSVALLVATGIYASTLHIERPEVLVTTRYGASLLGKVALVGLTLALAALNRWHFLPRLRAGGSAALRHRFGTVLLIEAGLLLAIFTVTGVLTTSPLPHD